MTAIFFATKSEKQRKYVYRRTRRPSISYLQEHGLDLSISCQIKAISEWKLDLMAAKVFEHLTFDKGKTVKEVYRILNRCMAEEKTGRIFPERQCWKRASLSRRNGWAGIPAEKHE